METVPTEVAAAMEVSTAAEGESDRRTVPIVRISAVVRVRVGVASIATPAMPMAAMPPTPVMAIAAVVNRLDV